jgi:hypothetical protein
MSDHGTASIGSWVEFVSSVVRQLPRPEEIDATICEGWSKNQESLKKVLAGALLPPTKVVIPAKPRIVEALPDIDWPLTYAKLGMEAEYTEVSKKFVFPPTNPNLWIVPMFPGVTPNKIVSGYRNLGVDVYTYRDDLDTDVTQNDRDPNRDGAYLIGFRRTIEADEENANKSASQLAKVKHKGIVLCERLLLGFGFYVTTGQPLDVKNQTLCTGSRDAHGDVPNVYWNPDSRKVYVYGCNPDYRGGSLRSRSVVSLPA